jgi:hypothetical protein
LPFISKLVVWEILIRGKIVHHEGLQVWNGSLCRGGPGGGRGEVFGVFVFCKLLARALGIVRKVFLSLIAFSWPNSSNQN